MRAAIDDSTVLRAVLDPLVRAIARQVVDELRPLVEEVRAAAPAPGSLATKQQTAAALGVSCATLDRYVREGLVPYVQLGPDGPRRFPLEQLLATLPNQRQRD